MPPPADGFAARLVIGPALRTQPDRRLVKLVRDGYESAFEEIVRRYGKPLTRYAGAIVGGRAEDVTQDAFSKALLALRRDDAEIDLRPWLFRIVRNTALNDLRDSPPAPEELAETILGGGRSAAEEVERREELAELIERLRALPEPQRAAIVMRELEGLSHEEIAAALGLSGGAARQAIYRARMALRDGAGMLLPLPLLKALIDNGEAAAAGAGAGGAALASGAAGGAGAGVAMKAGVVTAVLAGSVGTGIALQESDRGGSGAAGPSAAAAAPSPTPAPARSSAPTPPTGVGVGVATGRAGEGEANDGPKDQAPTGPGDDRKHGNKRRPHKPHRGRHGPRGPRHGPRRHGPRGHRAGGPRHHRGPERGIRPEDGNRGPRPDRHRRGDREGEWEREGEGDFSGPDGDGTRHDGSDDGSGTHQPPPPPPEEERTRDGGEGSDDPESGSSGSGENEEVP